MKNVKVKWLWKDDGVLLVLVEQPPLSMLTTSVSVYEIFFFKTNGFHRITISFRSRLPIKMWQIDPRCCCVFFSSNKSRRKIVKESNSIDKKDDRDSVEHGGRDNPFKMIWSRMHSVFYSSAFCLFSERFCTWETLRLPFGRAQQQRMEKKKVKPMLSEIPIGLLSSAPRTRKLSHGAIEKK